MGFKRGNAKVAGAAAPVETMLTADQRELLKRVDTQDVHQQGPVSLVKAESEPSTVGEWLSPAEGLLLEQAKIVRVFLIEGQRENEGPRANYVYSVPVEQVDGSFKDELMMLGERDFMKPQRILNIGAVVDLEFIRQEGARNKWIGRIDVHSKGTGPNIFATLVEEWKKLASGVLRDFRPPAPSEEVLPF
jgi:hypothetical protein